MKIVHIINSLDTGGAETVMLRLLNGSDRAEFDPSVISLTDLGPIADELRKIDVPAHALGFERGAPFPNPKRIMNLARFIKTANADVVQTWMYHSNLLGGIAALWAGGPPVVWCVRQTNLDRQSIPRKTAFVARLGGRMSGRLANRIVYNSEASRSAHAAIGYKDQNAVVIPNGFDPDILRPDAQARASVRDELGLTNDAVLVGLIARFDPQKDHENFVRAAAQVHHRHPQVQFVLAGLGSDETNSYLVRWIGSNGIDGVCHLLGHRTDIRRLAAAFDVGCLSSMGEGFPNVVGEIMSSGVPCAVTDVGDVSHLVGDTGRVVPPRDPSALADAVSDLISMGAETRHRLGSEARLRIEDLFHVNFMVERFQSVWREAAQAQ